MKIIRPLSIQSKLLIIFLLAGVLPIAVVSLISHYNSLKAVEEMVGNRTERVSESVAQELGRKLRNRFQDQILTDNTPVQSFLGTLDERDPQIRIKRYMELDAYARTLFEEYGAYYREIVLADTKGNPVYQHGHTRVPEGALLETRVMAQLDSGGVAYLDSLAVSISGDVQLTERVREIEEYSQTLGELLRRRSEAAAPEIADTPRGTLPRPPVPPAVSEVLERAFTRVVPNLDPDFQGPELPRDYPGAERWRVIPPILTGQEYSDDIKLAAKAGMRLAEDQKLIFIHRDAAGKSEALRIIRPVFSIEDDGRRLGSLITDTRADYLFPEDLAAERFGAQGELAVINMRDGEILFHSRSELIGKDVRQVSLPLADAIQTSSGDGNRFGSWQEIPSKQGARLASIVPVPEDPVPWLVVATSVPREFETEARRAGIINILVALLAVILALAVLLTSSGRISSSIHVVTDGARAIAAGNLNHSIEVNTHDEIQTLAEAFNGMTESLRENIALRENAARELSVLNRNLEDRVRERTQELEELNQALNSANQELKELDRLKSNFLSTVSHEFKTPLTSIKAFSEILLDEMGEAEAPPEVTRFLGIINTESERLGRLIKNLLDLSRIEAGRMVWERSVFPMQEVTRAALDGLLPVFAEKQIEVIANTDCAGVRVEADRDRIQQVITNLLENAVKFSEKGKRIWMTCKTASGKGNGAPVLEVAVRDEGTGIPTDHLDRIFERFSQVDSTETRSAGGSGLGLAISKEIIEHHGGWIWAQSDLGTGTTFRFTLPILSDSEEEKQTQTDDKAEEKAATHSREEEKHA